MKKLIQLCIVSVLLSACSSEKEQTTEDLKWDFSEKGKEYVYSYFQKLDNESSTSANPSGLEKASMEATGDFYIITKEGNIANFVLKNLNAVVVSELGDKQEQNMPETSFNDVSDVSFYAGGNNIEQSIIYMIFPLPQSKTDSVYSFNCSVPFNINGTPLSASGPMEVKKEKYTEIDGHKCVVLTSSFKAKDNGQPINTIESYNCSSFGSGKHIFDLDRGCFLSSEFDVQLKMNFLTTQGHNENMNMKSYMIATLKEK